MSRIPVRTPSRTESRDRFLHQDPLERAIPPMYKHIRDTETMRPATVGRVRPSTRATAETVKTPSRPAERKPATATKAASQQSSHVHSVTQVGSDRSISSDLAGKRPGTAKTIVNDPKTPNLRKHKSTAGLREHIAKARADLQKSARKPVNAMQTPSDSRNQDDEELPGETEAEDPFSLIKDPFNQAKLRPKVDPSLNRAIGKAREDGKLNISNMQLCRIPDDVYSMYKADPSHVIDFSMDSKSAWYDYAELTHFNAADNEISEIEDLLVDVFGGLESINLHNNNLRSLPQSLLRLDQLTSLNLAGNKLGNDALDLICQFESLIDLNMSRNSLNGLLTPNLANLQSLNTLELQENDLEAIDYSLTGCPNLQKLNLSGNKITKLCISQLAKQTGLVELDASRNKISSVLVDSTLSFPRLEILNLSHNSISELSHAANHTLSLPSLGILLLLQNRLKDLDGLTFPNLINLNLEGNQFTALPDSLYALQNLRHLDISDNKIPELSYKLGSMNLTQFRWQGNPVQMRGVFGMTTEEILRHLRKYAPIQDRT